MPDFTLTVNGAPRVVNVAADTPLLYVLRNELELSGPRLGCGMSQCGACAVLADGKEIRSCTTPIARVGDRKIHTIEGLPGLWAAKKALTGASAINTLHPIQQAWIDVQVPQCGYCQSGMMITAADLLARIHNPTVAQIKDAYTNQSPSPHLCRCGTYPAIIEAVRQAAKAMAV
jgi:aerobic-type carbon monoxide dehydrogenase small subunit (CoxS/CutS family)